MITLLVYENLGSFTNPIKMFLFYSSLHPDKRIVGKFISFTMIEILTDKCDIIDKVK